MTTRYVDKSNPSAADSNSGTLLSPLLTMARASLVSAPGDTVNVMPGTYNEQVEVRGNGVSWQGFPGTVIDGQNTRSFAIRTNSFLSTVIQGFEIKNCTVAGVMAVGGGDNQIRYNYCHDNGTGIRLQPNSPQLFSPVDGGAGGTLAAATYSYAVTAVYGTNETLSSFILTVTTTAANHKVNLSWDKSNLTADSFNVYGRGQDSVLHLLANVANTFGAAFPTWVDDGSISPGAKTIPLVSTVNITPCLIEGNEVTNSVSHGIYLYGAINSFVRGNKAHHGQFHGIALLNTSNGNEVSFNTCYNNVKPGAGVRIANGITCDSFGTGTNGSSNNVIEFNTTFLNQDTGINIYNGSNNNVVRRNLTFSNGDHGIDNFNCSGTHMINNTAYNNVAAGLNAEGTSANVVMKNNLSVDNGVNSPRTTGNYRMDQVANLTGVMDYNLSYLTVAASKQTGGAGLANAEFTWGTTTYGTLAAFRTAVPAQMVHGISADPQFKELVDYKLLPSSPAWAAGTASAEDYLGFDYTGQTCTTPPAVGAQE